MVDSQLPYQFPTPELPLRLILSLALPNNEAPLFLSLALPNNKALLSKSTGKTHHPVVTPSVVLRDEAAAGDNREAKLGDTLHVTPPPHPALLGFPPLDHLLVREMHSG